MSEITIPFREDMQVAVLSGNKTATSRTKRYGEIGDYFIINGRKFVLSYVHRIMLDEVVHGCWQKEGMESIDQFKKIWAEIHPRKGYDPNQMVWYHEWKEKRQ